MRCVVFTHTHNLAHVVVAASQVRKWCSLEGVHEVKSTILHTFPRGLGGTAPPLPLHAVPGARLGLRQRPFLCLLSAKMYFCFRCSRNPLPLCCLHVQYEVV